MTLNMDFGFYYANVRSSSDWISIFAVWRFWSLVKSGEVETGFFHASSFTLSDCYKILYLYHVAFVKILISRLIWDIKFRWREIIYLCIEIFPACTSVGSPFLFMYFHFFVILFIFTDFFLNFLVFQVEALKVLFWFIFSLKDVMLFQHILS